VFTGILDLIGDLLEGIIGIIGGTPPL